jgi:hypothetical protein
LTLAAVAGHCVTGGRTDLGLQNFRPSPIEKMIPNQSVLALTARIWALQNCMSLIPKAETGPASGFISLSNLFILNNLAERVGFEPRLSNEINKLGGANGTPNLRNSAKTNNSTSYWTLNGR